MREELGYDPTDGALYLFVSQNRIRAKVLMWDGTGLCLYAKEMFSAALTGTRPRS